VKSDVPHMFRIGISMERLLFLQASFFPQITWLHLFLGCSLRRAKGFFETTTVFFLKRFTLRPVRLASSPTSPCTRCGDFASPVFMRNPRRLYISLQFTLPLFQLLLCGARFSCSDVFVGPYYTSTSPATITFRLTYVTSHYFINILMPTR